MTAAPTSYRWNTSDAAEAYDLAALAIHPYYVAVQDRILDRMPFGRQEPFELVDLGGGSGRLVERVLERFTGARVTVVDQSEPFLALAERRLARFAPRAAFLQRRLQDNWGAELSAAPNVIVSTSAIHHLAPEEKQLLFARCLAALAPGGTFINGDEYRPTDDREYLALFEEWSTHMFGALDEGRIPESFRATLDYWHDRNIRRFGEPKASGDDCHETIAAQVGYLRNVGFVDVETIWAVKFWGVLATRKADT
jgi:SAM-dependent methyltransferase